MGVERRMHVLQMGDMLCVGEQSVYNLQLANSKVRAQ